MLFHADESFPSFPLRQNSCRLDRIRTLRAIKERRSGQFARIGAAGAHGHEGGVVEMVLGEEEMAVVDERHAEQGDERADYDELDERGTALARAAWRLWV